MMTDSLHLTLTGLCLNIRGLIGNNASGDIIVSYH